MTIPEPESREEDMVLLRVLSGDMTYQRAAVRLGKTRDQIAGLIQRIRRSPDRCASRKPENRDGGMPIRWWAR